MIELIMTCYRPKEIARCNGTQCQYPHKWKQTCRNCNGNADDYYGEGYSCDQCKFGYQEVEAHE